MASRADGPRLPRVLTVGVVGAGRSRVGTGPFLAAACERAGLRVAAIAGRDHARTQTLAQRFATEFGHPVAVHDSALALAQSGLDALVIATPPEHHLEGLQAAAAARLHCLCEKPLVAPDHFDAGLAAVAAIAASGRTLAENCQWPHVLPAFDALFPGVRKKPARSLQMRLSPAWPGRDMLLDSLSHVLSLAQAALPDDAAPRLRRARLDDPQLQRDHNVLRFDLGWQRSELTVELQLAVCREQPRPAWFAIDGHRVDRHIGTGYEIALTAGDRQVAVPDPLVALVEEVAAQWREPQAGWARRRRDLIEQRLWLYRELLDAVTP